ncbi:MAG: AIR synthase family protein [Synergistaceae bacterium]|nr:AIR synthase family protein [Synergistaceae bacterium]
MPGKLQPDVLRRNVLDFTGALRDDLLVGGGIGEDAALIKVPEGILVAASDPVTGASKNAGALLVHINANDLACKGADPAWLVVTLIVPDAMGVSFISDIMSEIHETCASLNIAIAGGHTELTDKYDSPVISGTMLGMTSHELSAKKIREGDLILATGHAGLEGMSILANDREDLLKDILTPDEIATVKSWGNDFSVVKPARILRDYARYMHDPTEGGINGALYEVQQGAGLGLELYADEMPVSELTLRAARELSFNYMNLISSGMLIAVIEPGLVDEARTKLQAANIGSRVIGKFTSDERISLPTNEELWEILAR